MVETGIGTREGVAVKESKEGVLEVKGLERTDEIDLMAVKRKEVDVDIEAIGGDVGEDAEGDVDCS